MYCQFTVFPCKFHSPQEKQNFVSIVTNFEYSLLNELSNINFKTNWGKKLCPISPTETIFWQYGQNHEKSDIKLSWPSPSLLGLTFCQIDCYQLYIFLNTFCTC